MPYFLFAAVLVAADQLVKLQVMEHIALGEHVPFLPYLLDLTYVRNTGAAFSLFSGHTWILAAVSCVMSLLLAWCLWKGVPFKRPLGRLTVALLLAGAVGNLIDRVFRGYVVDMFNVLFMDFAVFNVADVCIVVGGFAALAYYLLFASKLEETHETNSDS